MDLASKIIAAVIGIFSAGVVALGLIYRRGKSDERIIGELKNMRTDIDAKLEALRIGQATLKDGQAENRARSEEILVEVRAHTGDSAVHVNAQFEALRGKMDEDFRHDVKKKLDELLRAK